MVSKNTESNILKLSGFAAFLGLIIPSYSQILGQGKQAIKSHHVGFSEIMMAIFCHSI